MPYVPGKYPNPTLLIMESWQFNGVFCVTADQSMKGNMSPVHSFQGIPLGKIRPEV